MQRKVSLVVTEQEHNQDHNANEEVKQNNGYCPSASDALVFGKHTCPRRYAVEAAPMGHVHSMWCCDDTTDEPSNGLKESFYKCQSAERSKPRFPPKRVSFDDLDIGFSGPNLDERGSVPMIGSLVYYRHKSDSDILNKTEGLDSSGNVPPPEERMDAPHVPPLSTTIKDAYSSDNEEALVSDAEDLTSSLRPLPDMKKYRHFSYPWISINTSDEFGLINSKINSRIRQNDERLNRHLQNQRRRSHFRNTHYHIPGLDPEPTPESSDPSEAPSPASYQLQNRSNSASLLNSASSSNIPNYSPNNNRHRRRLTCAMIFTHPKVVEI